jgi:hypothetical protein
MARDVEKHLSEDAPPPLVNLRSTGMAKLKIHFTLALVSHQRYPIVRSLTIRYSELSFDNVTPPRLFEKEQTALHFPFTQGCVLRSVIPQNIRRN